MIVNEIDITFGKSILVEKAPKKEFTEILAPLCQKVEGSFLHCYYSHTGWVTIIRYAYLQPDSFYRVLRIVLVKDVNFFNESNIEYLNNNHFIKSLLHHISISTKSPVTFSWGLINCFDSGLLACGKENLAVLINELMHKIEKHFSCFSFSNSGYIPEEIITNNLSTPFIFCDQPNNSAILFDEDENHTRKLRPVSTNKLAELTKLTGNWQIKLKRKGRRALIKNVHLKPI